MSSPLIRTEAEKIIPTCNDNEEVLDYLKELLQPGIRYINNIEYFKLTLLSSPPLQIVQQSIPSQDAVAVDPVINEPSLSSERVEKRFQVRMCHSEFLRHYAIEEPEKSENNLQTAEATEESEKSENNLQTAEAIKKTYIGELPNNPVDTHLPETASGLLRYYELWNCHYTKWPGLNEYSDHLRDISKDRVHHSFKKEIEVLRTLFANEHPAHLRLTQLESQLKMRQSARMIKRTTRKRVADATKLLAKKVTIKKELEIEEDRDSAIVNGYRRINKHYDNFHEASTQLVKRKLLADNDSDHGKIEVEDLKRCRQQ
ncbi:12174_t:CDS:2 [Ambispora leptoticha]|uniref:12174_t:CDS:1 n=1 Tax=Ambispora leptoticha TaxID=144679 RepID=A0A9N9FZF0_9GLOM|nr:12174_t:CDS:2 [Ambispora leptoticha]